MKDLSLTKKILGIELIRDKKRDILWLTQLKYIRSVLERVELENSKSVQTPLPAHFKLSCLQCPKIDNEKCKMVYISYSSVVGCLMYAMILTRPVISCAISVLNRYMANPSKECWK